MRNKELPDVTVFSLVYNTGKYVIEAIEALRAQTYPSEKIEHIVIDDYSTDGSADLVGQWIKDNNHKCLFVRHEENWGICKTLNQVQSLANGKYICGLSDDLWEPDYLSDQIQRILQEDREVAFVYADAAEINESGKVIQESYLKKIGLNPNNMPEGFIYDLLLQNSFIPTIAVVMNKDLVDQIGGYDENLISEDIDMWLRLTKEYPIAYNNINKVKYRRYQNSFTVSSSRLIYKSKLLTFEKHWSDDPKINQTVYKRAKYYVVPCYLKQDKVIARNWAIRTRKYANSVGERFIHVLMDFGIHKKIIELFYRLTKKIKIY